MNQSPVLFSLNIESANADNTISKTESWYIVWRYGFEFYEYWVN